MGGARQQGGKRWQESLGRPLLNQYHVTRIKAREDQRLVADRGRSFASLHLRPRCHRAFVSVCCAGKQSNGNSRVPPARAGVGGLCVRSAYRCLAAGQRTPSGLPKPLLPRPSPGTTLEVSASSILRGLSRRRFAVLRLAASRSGAKRAYTVGELTKPACLRQGNYSKMRGSRQF